MTIQERLQEAEQKFNNIQQRRSEHLKAAEEDLEEMHRLQGEWRVLKDLEDTESSKKQRKTVDPTTTIEAEVVEGK